MNDAVLKGRDTVSDAADRRIAELESEARAAKGRLLTSYDHSDRLMLRIKELEAKLVERDVYEAQQILPPEQAALIKHLATVERCIDNGGVVGDDGDQDCPFCHEYEYEHHLKDCAWLALQFDRKPIETMAMVEGWAWGENDRRDRDRARAMTPREQGPALTMMGLNEMLKAATAYVFQPGAGLESEIALRLKMDEINGTGLYPKPDLGIPDTAVAPPDDEDVP